MTLPFSETVDVGVFSRLFVQRTNSYKFLFVLSLLDALECRYSLDFPDSHCIRLRELVVGMLVHAWYPYIYFRLSFGTQDKVSSFLEPIALNHPFTTTFDANGKGRLRNHLDKHVSDQAIKKLLRYVVFRLPRIFFVPETRGAKDERVNRMVRELCDREFKARRPLYRILNSSSKDGNAEELEVHPDWVQYLRTNLTIVRGWAAWNWCEYMSSKNPNVPAVSEKLFPPSQRASLDNQRKFWRQVVGKHKVVCIYTGELLTRDNYALDHFLPWKFVLHDQLWNLIPVSARANSSKSDSLPASKYLGPFVDTQCLALSSVYNETPKKAWRRIIEDYVAGLRVKEGQMVAESQQHFRDNLGRAFNSTIEPLLSLAKQMGFAADWEYCSPDSARSQGPEGQR